MDLDLTQVVDVDDITKATDPDVLKLRQHLESGYARQVYLDGETVAGLVERRIDAGAIVAAQTNLLQRMPTAAAVAALQSLIDQGIAELSRIEDRLANVAGWASYRGSAGASIARDPRCSPELRPP